MSTAHNNETDEAWTAFLAARDAGGEVEITQAIFDYFLGVLPPCWMNEFRHLPGLGDVYCAFGQAEGFERVTVFYVNRIAGRPHYFCRLTDELNPKESWTDGSTE
jgi:hypothetical protein